MNTKEVFDNRAMKFDEMVKNSDNDELGLFEQYDEILEEIRGRIIEYRAKSILDIGCGTGNLWVKSKDKLDVTGIDQSLEMLLQFKRKQSGIRLKLGSFLDRPFWPGKFDIVVTTYAFHALDYNEKKGALNNMLEYLKDRGKIIIADFMFLNGEERRTCKIQLYNKRREDLWEAVSKKYYTDIKKLKDYVRSKGCKIHCEHIVNFTWIVEIEK